MNILSITAQKPHSTGSGTYLTELVKSLDNIGCKQAVVAGIYPDDNVSFPKGIDFYPVYLPFPLVGMSDIMPYKSTRYRDMTPEMLDVFENNFITVISAAIKEFRPDIIICHHLFYLTALVRKHFPNLTIYGICHGTCLRQVTNALSDEQASPWNIPIHDVISEIRKLDRIYALHAEQAKNISDIFGISKAEISVIGSGYNPDIFNINNRMERAPDDPVRICYAGKISSPKGIPELLDAIPMLSGENIRVTLAGGCQEDPILSRINDIIHSGDSRLRYLGPLPQKDLAEVFKQNDILVLPSYFEGLSLVPIEAMACGLIPVCTDLPGMRDWVDKMVEHPNIKYIPMPEMSTIDSPTVEGRKQFTTDIASTLKAAIEDIRHSDSTIQPDTSRITWMEIALQISC